MLGSNPDLEIESRFGVGVESQISRWEWVLGLNSSLEVEFRIGRRSRILIQKSSFKSGVGVRSWFRSRVLGREFGSDLNLEVGSRIGCRDESRFRCRVLVQISSLNLGVGSGSGVGVEVRVGSISNVRSRVGSRDQVLNRLLGSCLRLGVGVWVDS